MSDLNQWIQQHRSTTLVLITAAFSGLWLRQGLRDGVTWLGGRVPLKPSRLETPALYWLAIWSHAITTALLALLGITLLVWAAILAI